MATLPETFSDISLEKLVEIPYEHRVSIVDDDDSFRQSIVRLLQCYGVETVGYRCAGEYLLANHPDCASCIVLDMCMPGPSGLELFDSLATRASSPPVIFVTAFSNVPATVHAIKAGAIDFLTKPVDGKRLLRATRAALALDAHRRFARAEIQLLRERFAQLTECERDVFIGVVNGKLNKQLAVTLNICERSVKTYRSRVMRKMCVSSLAALVRTAKVLNIAPCAPPELTQRLQPNRSSIARRPAADLSDGCRFPMY